MKTQPPPLWLSIFGLSSVLVIILSFFILLTLPHRNFRESRLTTLNSSSITTIIPTPTLIPVIIPVDSSGWDTYTNIEKGYSIKYPFDKFFPRNCIGEELTLNNRSNSSDPSYINRLIAVPAYCGRDNLYPLEIRTTVNLPLPTPQNNQTFKTVIRKIPVAGVSAYLYIETAKPLPENYEGMTPMSEVLVAFVPHNKLLYQIFYTGPSSSPEETQKDFLQILSTFKFLPDSSSWKTYYNKEYGFSLKYPPNWISPATGSHGDPDLTKNIFSAQHPYRQPSEPGSGFFPIFTISIYKTVSDIPPLLNYLQTQPGEISSTAKPLVIDGISYTEQTYKSFAVEGAYNITHQVRLEKNNQIYLLELGYTLAGCNNTPEDFRAECDKSNQQLITDSDQSWSQILSTFEFIN